MKLTTKGKYAVTALADVAMHQLQGPVKLESIAERQKISLPYLEQLFMQLRRSDIVVSTRGPGGGYKLAKNSENIYIVDILTAVDGQIDATNCKGGGNCKGGDTCLTHGLWLELTNHLKDFLGKISLAILIMPEKQQRIITTDSV